MKLYRTSKGVWVGTQAAAGTGSEQVDVPTDKPSLLKWLNENCTAPPLEPDFLEAAEARAAAAAQPRPSMKVFDLTGVELFIQECGPVQLGRIADNVCQRMRELMRMVVNA